MLKRPFVAIGLASLLGGALVVLAPSAYADHCGETPGVIEVGCHGPGTGTGSEEINDPCDYAWVDEQPPPGTDGHTAGVGGRWYWQTCPGRAYGRLAWVPDRPSAQTRAWNVLARIRIAKPSIRIVPDPAADSNGLVGLPVWLWVPNEMPYFGTRTDTDSGGGITVTLTVKSQKIVWNMGDGTEFACDTAGLPYEDRYGITTPDGWCGHRYKKSSKDQPGGRYTITATTFWHATWSASSGERGVIDQQMTSTTSVRIEELQVVIGG
jgi:hypothetical protein